jgi:hypothetical protein
MVSITATSNFATIKGQSITSFIGQDTHLLEASGFIPFDRRTSVFWDSRHSHRNFYWNLNGNLDYLGVSDQHVNHDEWDRD